MFVTSTRKEECFMKRSILTKVMCLIMAVMLAVPMSIGSARDVFASEEGVSISAETLEEIGLDSNKINEIKEAYEEDPDKAYEMAEIYVKTLKEMYSGYDSLRTEDFVKAIVNENSTGNTPVTPTPDNSGSTGTTTPTPDNSGSTGTTLKATIKVPATSFKMKVKQTYSGFKVTMGKGDSIKSVTSNKTSIVKISNLNKTKDTFTIKAQKKTGKATITIKLTSGVSKKLTINVQKGDVKTTKISNLKNLSLKKGKKTTLKPVITPITSKQKVTFKTSNKKIATVTSKGVIKGVKKGKAKITVTSGSKKKTITVTVK